MANEKQVKAPAKKAETPESTKGSTPERTTSKTLYERWSCKITVVKDSDEPEVKMIEKLGECKITDEQATVLNEVRFGNNLIADMYFLPE